MHIVTDRQTLPYTAEQLYAIVAQIEKYPDFIPWVKALRVLRTEGDNTVVAEVLVEAKKVRDSYICKVIFHPPHRIEVDLVSGPLEHLINKWQFRPLPEGGSEAEFSIDFKFRSKIYNMMVPALLGSAKTKIRELFKKRAVELYGRTSP